jgi:hypothetical protein
MAASVLKSSPMKRALEEKYEENEGKVEKM